MSTDAPRERRVAGTRSRLLPSPTVLRENLTGYLFISPAVFLIFIFGLFPIGYALYMSLHVWVVQKRNYLCRTPISGGDDGMSASVLAEMRRCLQHYEQSAVGDWNGVFVAAVGFGALFVAYWFWVNVFSPKQHTVRVFLGWQVMLLTLALSLIVVALNSGWHPLLQLVLGAVIVLGAFWFWTNAASAGHSHREGTGQQSQLMQRILGGMTALIGGGTLLWGLISGAALLSGTVLFLQHLSINQVIVTYLGLLLLMIAYLSFVQDNDRLRNLPLSLWIDRIVRVSLRGLGIVVMANILVALSIGVGAALIGSTLTWAQVTLISLALLVGFGLLGVPFGIYVLGDELQDLRIRDFLIPVLATFAVISLLGIRVEDTVTLPGDGTETITHSIFAIDMIRAAFQSLLVVLDGVAWSALGFLYVGFLLMVVAYSFWRSAFQPDARRMLARWMVALAILAVSVAVISYGWNDMLGALTRRNQDFLRGLEFTVYYAFGSIPLQLALGLLLAYVLFLNIRGKEWYRMIFFLPYVTPVVAAAVVFGRIFNGGATSLMNSFLDSIGAEMYRWVNEPEPFLNVIFGLNLDGFVAGPSMAMVSVIVLGIWTYTGYNAVIFLAGLGGIPSDLYEAAKVDGASQWHLFRYITLPLLSPITFYLSLLGFIGTFQAFNTLFVIRTPAAQGTLDTAALVIYDTFQKETKYGEAAAQAVALFIIILLLTQIQRNVFEKRVFYG